MLDGELLEVGNVGGRELLEVRNVGDGELLEVGNCWR